MKDNFSQQAKEYARHRPHYPSLLFEYITGFSQEKKLAWDCGTGNGQSAKELSKYFERVHATDISSLQIEYAERKENIRYALEPAEKTSLEDNSVDLITISQALHWFDFDLFYKEVKRVCKPGAMIAAWAYNIFQTDEPIKALTDHYYKHTLDGYWDDERKYIDEEYITIPFPFKQVEAPAFNIEVHWGRKELEGYLSTWSASQKFIKINNYNPLPELMQQIEKYWPGREIKSIIFPIHLKLGYVH